jgi:hypothetical protein
MTNKQNKQTIFLNKKMAEPFVSNKIVLFTGHHKLEQLVFVFQSFAACSMHGTQIEQIGCALTGFKISKNSQVHVRFLRP